MLTEFPILQSIGNNALQGVISRTGHATIILLWPCLPDQRLDAEADRLIAWALDRGVALKRDYMRAFLRGSRRGAELNRQVWSITFAADRGQVLYNQHAAPCAAAVIVSTFDDDPGCVITAWPTALDAARQATALRAEWCAGGEVIINDREQRHVATLPGHTVASVAVWAAKAPCDYALPVPAPVRPVATFGDQPFHDGRAAAAGL